MEHVLDNQENSPPHIRLIKGSASTINLDPNGQITALNARAAELLGGKITQATPDQPQVVLPPAGNFELNPLLPQIVSPDVLQNITFDNPTHQISTYFYDADGKSQYHLLTYIGKFDDNGSLLGYSIIENDATDLNYKDPVTGLNTKIYAQSLFEQSDHIRNYPLAVLMVDLNGLKQINDNEGHFKGDVVLKTVADSLIRVLRTSDGVVRWGGDEFVCLLSSVLGDETTLTELDDSLSDDEITQAHQNIQLIIDRINKELVKTGYEVAVGYALKFGGDQGLEELVDEADEMMYQDKDKKYQAHNFGPSVQERLKQVSKGRND